MLWSKWFQGGETAIRTNWIKLSVFCFLLLAIGTVCFFIARPYFHTHSLEDLLETVRQLGALAWIAVSACMIVQSIVPYVPFAFLAGSSVLLFGFVEGFLLSLASAVIGSCLMFLMVRWGAKDAVVLKLNGKDYYQKFAHLLAHRGFQVVFFARLIPVLPLTFVNASAAVSPIRFSTFFWASLAGKIPIIAAEAAFGAGVMNWQDHLWLLIAGGGVILILSGLGWWLKKKMAGNHPA